MLFSRAGKLFSGSSGRSADQEFRVLSMWKREEPVPEPRKLGVWAGTVNQQEQSALLRLPAEIRNMVYTAVFTPEAREIEEQREEQRVKTLMAAAEREREKEKEKKARNPETANVPITSFSRKTPKDTHPPPHPLALLLTCRKVSDDATLLAFALHPHLTAPVPSYHALRRRALRLPPQSLAAVTSLALAFTDKHYWSPCSTQVVAEFLTNAVLLSPSITHLTIRVTTRADDQRRPQGFRLEHAADEACLTHVPSWFEDALGSMRSGRSYVWQTGEKWGLVYPMPHVHLNDTVHQSVGLSTIACRGDCAAVLTQEGSEREIKVKVEYVWDWEAVRRREEAGLNVRLVPGEAERLELKEVFGGTGLVWDPEGVYGEGLCEEGLGRRKKERGFGGCGVGWLKVVMGGKGGS